MRGDTPDRRQLLGSLGACLVGSLTNSTPAQAPISRSPDTRAPVADPVRLVPRADLVNTLDYEQQARRRLAPPVYALVADGDRSAFDRITLRPRLLMPVLDMDLGATLFGDALFTPIIVGPIAGQQRFHADGELATLKGAAAARTVMVVGSHSTVPLEVLAAQATTPLWYQVFPGQPAARRQSQQAVQAGCRAICATVGARPSAPGARLAASIAPVDWTEVAAIKRAVSVPVLVKGVTTPRAARLALQHGADGLVVSTYGGLSTTSRQVPIVVLPAIVDAVGGKVPVLVDGSFRRGTDILKALALGAQAVLVGRPIMWGLAAYGAEGVQGVIEMLQSELARYMGMCGKSNLASLDRTTVRLHG